MRDYKCICDNIENIENYEKAKADNFKGWICHHRLETHTSEGERRPVDLLSEELKALGMYYHRPAEELIFLTHKEHRCLHQKGKHRSDETKKNIAKSNKGKHHCSEETRRKMSASWDYDKHFTQETRRKMSKVRKNKPTWIKGNHHSEETKRKIAKANKGMHWYNNGTKSTMAKTCPEGFVPGRLKYEKESSK